VLFCSGATRLSGRFTEGFSLRRLHPKKAGGNTATAPASKTTTPAQVSGAEDTQPARKRRRAADTTAIAPSRKRATRGKKPRKPKFGNPPVDATPSLHLRDVGSNTPLKIPYGNKEVAQKLGARYSADGWYAPPGVDLSAFTEKGWL
jgi:DNA topoisomerase-3